MKFNIIGAGKLGKQLAAALSAHGLGHLNAVLNRSLDSANKACTFIGAGTGIASLEALPLADITFLTCPDDVIASMAQALSQSSVLQPQSSVIHCSGVLSSDILEPLKVKGHAIASLHPLKAFGSPHCTPTDFDGVDCIIEGDDLAVKQMTQLFGQLNANMISIRPEAKAAYHAGACIASNYLITLAAAASRLFTEAGISPEQAQIMICNLMQGNIHNLRAVSEIKNALTGPLMRGDTNTIAMHLQAIKCPDIMAMYQSAGRATLEMTSLDAEKKETLRRLCEQGEAIQ